MQMSSFKAVSQCCLPVLRKLALSLALVLSISFASWLIVRFMAHYCYPPGWSGPFVALLSMGNPVCHTLNTIQLKLADVYLIVFGSVVTLVVLKIGESISLVE
jgi:hypothetical protein